MFDIAVSHALNDCNVEDKISRPLESTSVMLDVPISNGESNNNNNNDNFQQSQNQPIEFEEVFKII